MIHTGGTFPEFIPGLLTFLGDNAHGNEAMRHGKLVVSVCSTVM